jgi:hypothetical protein
LETLVEVKKNPHVKLPEYAGTTQPEKSVDTLVETDTQVQQDSHVYVHCYFENPGMDMLIRIWRSTYLIDNGSSYRAKLVHAENISFAPQWTMIPGRKYFRFLLIFEGLPKSCTQFSLLEDIPQAGGFFVENISRNETDVYHVDIR